MSGAKMLTRAALGAAILTAALIGGFFVGALGALTEDSTDIE